MKCSIKVFKMNPSFQKQFRMFCLCFYQFVASHWKIHIFLANIMFKVFWIEFAGNCEIVTFTCFIIIFVFYTLHGVNETRSKFKKLLFRKFIYLFSWDLKIIKLHGNNLLVSSRKMFVVVWMIISHLTRGIKRFYLPNELIFLQS